MQNLKCYGLYIKHNALINMHKQNEKDHKSNVVCTKKCTHNQYVMCMVYSWSTRLIYYIICTKYNALVGIIRKSVCANCYA